jgi:hypothetical protein
MFPLEDLKDPDVGHAAGRAAPEHKSDLLFLPQDPLKKG